MNHPIHHYTVETHKGRPLLFENGKPRPLIMYCPGNAFGNVSREDVDRFLSAGVTDFYLWVGRDETEKDGFTTPFWQQVNQLGEPRMVSPERFISLPEKIEYIIQRAPDARFLLRYYAHAPKSWKAAHPEEMAVNEEGTHLNETSLASLRYEEDHRRALRHMLAWIESQSWAWRVFGYITLHEFEGTTLYSCEGGFYDYSEPMRRAFCEFAPQWEDIPTNRFLRERIEGGAMNWPEPGTTRIERDYCELVRRLFLRRCQIFLETARETVGSRMVLLGMDALKQGMQGWICSPFFEGKRPRVHHSHMLAASGSIAAEEVFSLPGFNVLNTPYDYIYRHMGGSPEPEGIVDSCTVRGTLFLVENDCRSFAAHERESYGYYRDAAEVQAGMWREAAAAIARGYQTYWMDVTSFPSPRGGYFRDPAIVETIRSIVPVMRRSLEWEHIEIPSVAMIIDDRAALWEDLSADFQNLSVMWQRLTGLAHIGAPYRIYLWEDLAAGRIPDHRFFIFPNLFYMDETREAVLRERVCRNGHVVLWGPSTGITDGKSLSDEWATRITGMPMTLLHENWSRRVALTRFDHPITRNLHGAISYGDSMPYGPILVPERDPSVSEQGIALTTRGINRPGLVIKEFGKGDGRWTSIFSVAAPLPANLLREMARHAGAHIYSEENDVILASRNFLAVHSVRGGRRTIRLPQLSSVRDAVTGKEISPSTDVINLDIQPPQTRLFLLNL